MIVINDIKDIPAQLYCPDKKLIGVVTDQLQMNDVCIQIKNMKLPTEKSGYYFVCEGIEIDILSNGRIPNLNHLNISFFGTNCKQLEKLLFNK
jgi:hypothetical protein